jgi:DNA mismatch repair protein MutS
MILSALTETPPLRISDGGVFQDGYHPELDRLRTLSRDSISWMNSYQLRLREETGIRTLKVGFTNAFGYYIEVSRAAGDKIPAGFQRQQTLVNTERFITEELKQFEHQALSAEERSKALEAKLFEDLRAKVATFATSVQQTAQAIAHIDALVSLSISALENRWTCPTVDSSDVLEIQEGRHPVVEQAIGRASFIANDTSLNAARQLMLITGPNMAGKSTYIRQVALLVILAQMGSYVPARFARIGLVDKIFSRIGASDDLARGQSTFMVEMTETANILNNATSRSLVLLDEIGRGTSTYDGIAIAWSVAEYLLTTPGKQAKTLFATHYSELTKLSQELPKAINYQVAVSETADGIVFNRKIIPGGTDKSYGIHVAKLAGIPYKAIKRAEEMLRQLEMQKPRASKKCDEQLLLL